MSHLDPTAPLAQRILDLLRAQGPMKARDLARVLGVDKADVNHQVYGPLSGRVQQGSDYSWSLVEKAAAGAPGPPGRPDSGTAPLPGSIASGPAFSPASPFAVAAGPAQPTLGRSMGPPVLARELFRYYLECLAEEGLDGVSVFATSRSGRLDYCELGSMPLDPNGPWAFHTPEATEFLARGGGSRRNVVFRIGLPVLVVERTGKDGQPHRRVEPLLLWSYQPGAGWDCLEEGLPSVNPSAVASLEGGSTSQCLEEVLVLNRDLGLEEVTENPEIDDLLLRLAQVRPHWPWVEPPDAVLKGGGEPLHRFSGQGILNRAVLVAVEGSKFTAGLREELGKLEGQPPTPGSALGRWMQETLGKPLPPEPAAPTGAGGLLEIVPLNVEQRAAIERALSEPLTVITGPPGTGKSQVVSGLLLNAAHRGLRVLFASKNHQAVDVVEKRVNELSDAPILMRLGGRGDHNRRLADYLDHLLSTTAGPDEHQALAEAGRRLEELQAHLSRLEADRDRLVAARNDVDRLEQEAEAARAVLGEERFDALADLDLDQVEADLRHLSAVAARADLRSLAWYVRLSWFAWRRSRLDALGAAFRRVGEGAAGSALLDLPKPPSEATEEFAAELVDCLAKVDRFLRAARTGQAYLRALRDLSGLPTLEESNRREAERRDELLRVSAEYWRAWMAVRPSTLSREARRTLADYAAVLRLIAKSQEQDGAVDGALWRKYYDLSQASVGALGLWAVTSLSARGRVPFLEGMFDLLVIDEASQCDIASALPLLYRARHAVIIGDPQQLRHISGLTEARDRQIQQRQGLGLEWVAWSYSTQSLYDLARAMTGPDDIQMLRDHHRSHPHIIDFSNRFFYGGKLRVVTRLDRLLPEPGDSRVTVRWVHVQGNSVRPPEGGLYNLEEAEEVVRELRRLVLDRGYRGSVGVVSPFRHQASRIRNLVAADRQLQKALEQRGFASDTVHRFQGDERDLVVFSPTVSLGGTEPAMGFLRGNPHLFNVAITRARACLVVVGDRNAARDALQRGVEYLGKFAEYVEALEPAAAEGVRADQGPEYPEVLNPHQVSEWERILYRALYAAGIPTIPQYSEDRYLLDLALVRGGRRLDIEVDGERYHRAWDGEVLRQDQLRNARLVELGWDVMRFWVYQVRDDLPGCVERVRAWVEGG